MFSYGGGEVREIRFRVWDTQMMKMYTNCPNVMLDYRGHPYWQFGFDEPKPMSDSIVMQYTGLKDKNGKEIYEGDILQIMRSNEPYPEKHFTVSWDINRFNVPRISWIYEVIGNIYENPKLLEATK